MTFFLDAYERALLDRGGTRKAAPASHDVALTAEEAEILLEFLRRVLALTAVYRLEAHGLCDLLESKLMENGR